MQQYAAFVRDREREKLTKESAAEEERRANLLVDWHDFVVSLAQSGPSPYCHPFASAPGLDEHVCDHRLSRRSGSRTMTTTRSQPRRTCRPKQWRSIFRTRMPAASLAVRLRKRQEGCRALRRQRVLHHQLLPWTKRWLTKWRAWRRRHRWALRWPQYQKDSSARTTFLKWARSYQGRSILL